MSGIPSIVAGLFIYSALISGSGKGFSGFMGALALSILMIPTVARTAEEVLKLVPADLREAGLALGATQWKTVGIVVIPAAKSGLVTAVILGVARIAGETAPLLFTTGGADDTNLNPMDGNMGTIPFYIWKALIDGSTEAASRAWAGLLILMIAVLALFLSLATCRDKRAVNKIMNNEMEGSNMNSTTTPTPNREASSPRTTSLGDVATASAASRTRTEQPVGSGLEARNVHAWFGKYHAISDMSLDFPTGTVTALIGPSGCGKSTFLRTLNRMHEFIPGAAMAGEVLLHGKDIYSPGTDVTKIRLKIGMVFQKPNPFPSMTIGENVLAGIKLAQLKVSNKKI